MYPDFYEEVVEVVAEANVPYHQYVADELDLVDQMHWEDCVEFLSLEEVGLEEDSETVHGQYFSVEGSIYTYTSWFYEDDDTFSVI
jgi:hypothetical protein